jgi:hypothetical protein
MIDNYTTKLTAGATVNKRACTDFDRHQYAKFCETAMRIYT